MQVAAAGAGSPSQPEAFAKTLPELARLPTPGRAEDDVSHSLQDLASPHITELLGRLEHARNSHDPQLFEGLLRTAVAAAGAHNVHEALSAIAGMAKLHPEHAAQLAHAEAGLAPIHSEVNHLFERLTAAARLEAVQTLAAAATVVPAKDLESVAVIATGERFLESGTYINYVRATELGQIVLASFSRPPKARSGGTSLSLLLTMLRAMWRRVPLLVLLAGWFVIGLIGGLISLAGRTAGSGGASAAPVEIWAAGFLILVGFQFVVMVRNIKWP
jgi:hypothetical protein